ncbi:hypothetical protein D3C77_506980 [compost metagenome]
MAVGVEAKWQLAAHSLLDVVAILLRLFTADASIAAGLFGFNHRQWFAIFAQQDVITELVALVGRAWLGHAFRQSGEDVELLDDLGGVLDIPTCLSELTVDKL